MKNLDAAVVIPAHKEGRTIVHTLASIGRSEKIENSMVGIFVVINQSRNAVQAVTDSNRETAELIRSLAKRRMPEGLSSKPRCLLEEIDEKTFRKIFGEVEISEKQAAEEFLDSGVKINEVNLWQGSYAPQLCNVGFARHKGVKTAIPFLTDESCPIVNTDADVYFSRNKLSSLISEFETVADTMGIMGKHLEYFAIDPDCDPTSLEKNLQALRLNRIKTYYNSACQALARKKSGGILYYPPNLVGLKKQIMLDDGISYWGCDTNFRASVYKEEVHFPFISFGEDTSLAHSMHKNGMKISCSPDFTTSFNARFSDRCTNGYGKSLETSLDEHRLGNDSVFSIDKIYLMIELGDVLKTFVNDESLEIDSFMSVVEKYDEISYEEKLCIWCLVVNARLKRVEAQEAMNYFGYTRVLDTFFELLNIKIYERGAVSLEDGLDEVIQEFEGLYDENCGFVATLSDFYKLMRNSFSGIFSGRNSQTTHTNESMILSWLEVLEEKQGELAALKCEARNDTKALQD